MDIVERLQHPQFADVAEKYLMVEAADYITRLRAALAEKEAAIAAARREAANKAIAEAAMLADFAAAEASITAHKHPEDTASRALMLAGSGAVSRIADAIRALQDSIT